MATRVVISGRVQGVSYRAYAQQAALRLGVRGWVRNLPDGRVEAVVVGPQAVDFVNWCRRGSPQAVVREVQTEEVADEGWVGFEIRR